MNKLWLLTIMLLSGNLLQAQPWMPQTNGAVKYSDALNSYYRYRAAHEADEPEMQTGRQEPESRHHLFEKWNWYWQSHLDKDGYMVPPVKNLTGWQEYVTMHSQAAARTTSVTPAWSFQGPNTCTHGYSGIGRINTVAFDPVDSNTFYVGSAAGGTWKTTNGGATWTPLYDFMPTLGVADIKVNPRNRNTIYVATGDGDHGDAYSSGVIVSHDGGAHWSTTGLSWLPTAYNAARSLVINPVDTTCMILASTAGIFKTHDAGATWTNVRSGAVKQVLFKPGDTTTVYATTDVYRDCQVIRSTNGGLTWSAVTSLTDAQRIAIAVSPANPNLVMALASDTTSGLLGVYSSTTSGASFTPVFTDDASCASNLLSWDLGLPSTGCGGQGWYDLCIAINPLNASEVTVGGVNTYYSSNGGVTWTLATEWYGGLTGVEIVHADKHCLAYNSLTGALFETCDGGVYKNYGPVTAPWTDLTDGLGITEFYRNAVDDGVTFCIGGAQDNGCKMVTGGGASTDLTGGDGMQTLINYGDPNNIWYCASQNGNVNMTRDGGMTWNTITSGLASGGWVTPYLLHPTDTATLVLGNKQVNVSYDNGTTWSSISAVFDTNQFIDRMAIAASNPNYIYATYYNYDYWLPVIYYTPDFGVTWDTIATPFNNYINDIKVDPTNEKRIWVAIGAYGVPKVWLYDMATATWTDKTGTLPDIPVESIVIDEIFKTVYIGTDAAVFYREPTMTDWALYNTSLPTVHVPDLHINYATNELWAATFGRGMWKCTKADIGSPLNVRRAVMNNNIVISPNPAHRQFVIRGGELKDGAASVKLVTTDGRAVWQSDCLAGGGIVRVNASGIPAGFYICEVVSGDKIFRSKLVVY